MTPSHSNISLVVISAIVAMVGLVDAIVSDEADFVAIFGVLVVLAAALLLRTRASRVKITLRSDLVTWLRRHSASTGESMEAVADRAVAAYRAQFVGDADRAVHGRHASGGDEPARR